jgi:hypothetical protein
MANSKFPIDIETIPDEDILYCRVHLSNIDKENGKIKPSAFDPTPFENPDGLSVNWSKYSNAEQTKQEVTLFGKKVENYSVVSFLTLEVRNISLQVIHKPTKNRAHSLILNIPPRKQNDARITMLLRDICKWEIY